MEKVGNMELYSFDDILDETFGEVGTPERDAMEAQLSDELNAYHLAEAVRNARHSQNLTQAALGEKAGIKPSQISKLENGHTSISLATIQRVFRALGFSGGTLDLGAAGKLALW